MNEFKTYIFSRARNTRTAFLVDINTPIEEVKRIMGENYRVWGGSYNPIVPIADGVIEKRWMEMLEVIDPDVVYHSTGVDVHKLMESGLRIFPREIRVIGYEGRLDMQGVNPLTFIDYFFRDQLSKRRHVQLPYFSSDLEHPLKSALNLNFGMREWSDADDEYLQQMGKQMIFEENIHQVLSLMWSDTHFVQNLLCEAHIENEILQGDNWRIRYFELIIYDQKNSLQDLIYFWNRKLYQVPSMRYQQLAFSIQEFELLCTDPFFHGLLSNHADREEIIVSSKSLDEAQLTELFAKCGEGSYRTKFRVVPRLEFPEPFSQEANLAENHWKRTLLQSREGFIYLGDALVGDQIRLKGTFELDVRIKGSGLAMDNTFPFPHHTLLRGNISDVPARVNRSHGLSFQVLSHLLGIDLRLPTVSDMLRSRVQIRDVAGSIQRPGGLTFCRPSRAGLLLSTMMKLFEEQWDSVRQRVLDKFWLEVFTGNGNYTKVVKRWKLISGKENMERGESPYMESKLAKGDGLFSLKDLHHELQCIYNAYASDISPFGEDCGEDFPTTGLNGWIKDRYEADQQSISNSLDYFVKCEAVFIGIKVACENCGSNLWYSLQELSHRMTCKGCSLGVNPKAESTYYYKVNDTVLNNLMSDPVKRLKAYGGNYLVFKVLDYLRDPIQEKMAPSFGFSPSLDIWLENQEFHRTDLDIVVLQNGKLIIGEAKMNAKQFSEQQIKQLIWIGNEIRPDVLMLAYQDGKLSEAVLEKIRQGLKVHHVQVLGMKIDTASFEFGVMRGLPVKVEVEGDSIKDNI